MAETLKLFAVSHYFPWLHAKIRGGAGRQLCSGYSEEQYSKSWQKIRIFGFLATHLNYHQMNPVSRHEWYFLNMLFSMPLPQADTA